MSDLEDILQPLRPDMKIVRHEPTLFKSQKVQTAAGGLQRVQQSVSPQCYWGHYEYAALLLKKKKKNYPAKCFFTVNVMCMFQIIDHSGDPDEGVYKTYCQVEKVIKQVIGLISCSVF